MRKLSKLTYIGNPKNDYLMRLKESCESDVVSNYKINCPNHDIEETKYNSYSIKCNLTRYSFTRGLKILISFKTENK